MFLSYECICHFQYLFLNWLFDAKTGKHAPDEVAILPLDLTGGEEYLAETVRKAESFFGGAGVDYMFHNAAYERPVSKCTML